jgi:hypothetical protein
MNWGSYSRKHSRQMGAWHGVRTGLPWDEPCGLGLAGGLEGALQALGVPEGPFVLCPVFSAGATIDQFSGAENQTCGQITWLTVELSETLFRTGFEGGVNVDEAAVNGGRKVRRVAVQ